MTLTSESTESKNLLGRGSISYLEGTSVPKPRLGYLLQVGPWNGDPVTETSIQDFVEGKEAGLNRREGLGVGIQCRGSQSLSWPRKSPRVGRALQPLPSLGEEEVKPVFFMLIINWV